MKKQRENPNPKIRTFDDSWMVNNNERIPSLKINNSFKEKNVFLTKEQMETVEKLSGVKFSKPITEKEALKILKSKNPNDYLRRNNIK